MISFGVTYWYLFLPIIILAAAGIAFFMYLAGKDARELKKYQKVALMSLRFFTLATIAFLLLSPFLKTLKRVVQNPLIIAAWDNSGSMTANTDSLTVAEEMEQLRNRISDELGTDYRLVHYVFGQETEAGEEFDFSGKKSDYDNLITTLSGNHYNEKIGALILTGDGIYNHGRNPLNRISDLTYPVFTIGLGDTTEVTDARIQDIRVNRTAFSGNRFPVEVDAAFTHLSNHSLKLTIREGDEEVAQTVISPGTDDYFFSRQFILEAGDPGLKHFEVVIEEAENEKNITNNRASFVVNVLENKQRILIVSHGPHPDIGAIANTLEQQKSYEVSIFHEEPYPSDLSGFNLIVVHQLPSAGKTIDWITKADNAARIPLLFITGSKTFIPQFNALSAGAEIQPLAGSAEEAQAVPNNAYASFTLSDRFREMVQRFPPLKAPFANYDLNNEFTPLLYQKIRNIDTRKPLLATGMLNGRKTGFLFGEGIWQWRLHNYLLNGSHDQFNELVTQLVQYLALRDNEDNLMIDFEPVVAETDDVVFTAEVYNDAYEPVTSGEVTIKINNEAGEIYEFTFDVRGAGYFLNAGTLPPGNYSFQAEVSVGGSTYTESGNFAVTEMNLEDVLSKANHRMLYQLALQTGGDFVSPDQTGKLIERLKESNHLKPVSSFSEIIAELLNQRWLFVVLILLLSVEWFLRKYWGIY